MFWRDKPCPTCAAPAGQDCREQTTRRTYGGKRVVEFVRRSVPHASRNADLSDAIFTTNPTDQPELSEDGKALAARLARESDDARR